MSSILTYTRPSIICENACMVSLIWEKYSLLRILEGSCAKKTFIHFLLFVLLTLNLLSENSKWGHLGVENSQGDRLHV